MALLSLESLLSTLSDLKKEGKKIVFTNGCFDLLHAGHTTYLKEAKTLGDILVIGLNSDHSVKQLKGPTRPLVEQQHRATVLLALSSVDFVVLFDEETPLSLIRAIQPDIHVKGGDYAIESLPETPCIKEYGGEIQILPFVPGLSTSSIIQKIKEDLHDSD